MTELQKLHFLKKYIEEEYQVDLSERCRESHLIGLRWIYFNLAKQYTKCSLQKIGEFIDRDHATVLHHNKTLPRDEWVPEYEKIKSVVDSIIELKDVNVNSKINPKLINEIINLKSKIRELEQPKGDSLDVRLMESFKPLNITRKMDLIYKAETLLKVQDKFKAA